MKVNFYHDEPIFGLDIRHSYLKAMQIEMASGKQPKVLGYGVNGYPPASIVDGVVVDFEALARSLHELFSNHIVGSIDTKRVACTIPTSRTFSRTMKLPPMDNDEIAEAVHLEAEQYIPLHPDNLYIDYDILRRDEQAIDLLMVATPRTIIDSYIKLLEAVGLQPVALEPTMNGTARLFGMADPSHDRPSILIDFGSTAIDLAAVDKTIFVNSTVAGGSDTLTQLIAQQLKIDQQSAHDLKYKEGLASGERQQAIIEAVKPVLDNLIREVHKVIRYYDERNAGGKTKISQIITLGEGATMPGFNGYLAQQLGMPTRTLNPWERIQFGKLAAPSELDRSIYTTVAGVAILNPVEIFG